MGGRSLVLTNVVLSILLFIAVAAAPAAQSAASVVTYINVVSLGARPDGKTDSTNALLSAWAQACASPNPAVIYVPPGSFLLNNVVFTGKCNNTAITFRIAGTLLAPSDYRLIGNADNWIFFQHVQGVTIYGGILDAQGTALWACKQSGKSTASCPTGATVRSTFFLTFLSYPHIIYFHLLAFEEIISWLVLSLHINILTC